jgi:hypothetical protein
MTPSFRKSCTRPILPNLGSVRPLLHERTGTCAEKGWQVAKRVNARSDHSMRGNTGTVERPLEYQLPLGFFEQADGWQGAGEPRLTPIRLAQRDTGSPRLASLGILHNSYCLNLKHPSLLFHRSTSSDC